MNLGVFAIVFGNASVEFFETAAIADAIAHSGHPKQALGERLQDLRLLLLQPRSWAKACSLYCRTYTVTRQVTRLTEDLLFLARTG
jgi:uncharacterized membrane protein